MLPFRNGQEDSQCDQSASKPLSFANGLGWSEDAWRNKTQDDARFGRRNGLSQAIKSRNGVEAFTLDECHTAAG